MGTRLLLIVAWFHWKLHTKKERNCSGRSRVRGILLTCIQMLLIQFLDVIWSMPKNFAFFQKPLDKFFYKFDNSEINRQEIFSASFKNIENGKSSRATLRAILTSLMLYSMQPFLELQQGKIYFISLLQEIIHKTPSNYIRLKWKEIDKKGEPMCLIVPSLSMRYTF